MKHKRIWICTIITLLGTLLTAGVVAAAQLQTQAELASLAATKVGLIPEKDGVTQDNLWAWASYQGLLKAETELGVIGTIYTPTDETNYGPQLQQCADEGNDLCISLSFMQRQETLDAAMSNPGTDFAILDSSYENYPDNLRGMVFSSTQVGYLAGVLAGLMTESDQIGVIGGMEISSVIKFVEGYHNGAQCNNPDVDVLVDYAGTFTDTELGATMAQDMIAQGADVIFGVAGPTGFGGILTATQSGVWAIGVDTDQYISLFNSGTVDGSDRLLSSAMKNIDNAVFNTISDVYSGSFTSGSLVYDLALKGVDLAPFHEADPYIPQSVKDTLGTVKQAIINGSIDINYDCRSYLFLPLTLRSK